MQYVGPDTQGRVFTGGGGVLYDQLYPYAVGGSMPTAQNDIADFLKKFMEIVQKIIDFFDGLSKNKTQALGDCEQVLIAGVKAELLTFAAKLPPYLQGYLQCKLVGFFPPGDGNMSPPTPQAQAGIGDLVKYLPQLLELIKNIGPIIDFIKKLLEAVNQVPTGPVQPNSPNFREVKRC